MALPGAAIWLFEGGAIRPVAWSEVEHVALTRSFLANPERFLKRL
jgi:predicted ATPase